VTIREHLDDLRTRIVRACLSLAIGMGLALKDELVAFVLAPALHLLAPNQCQ
jgi:hypothetical protein